MHPRVASLSQEGFNPDIFSPQFANMVPLRLPTQNSALISPSIPNPVITNAASLNLATASPLEPNIAIPSQQNTNFDGSDCDTSTIISPPLNDGAFSPSNINSGSSSSDFSIPNHLNPSIPIASNFNSDQGSFGSDSSNLVDSDVALSSLSFPSSTSLNIAIPEASTLNPLHLSPISFNNFNPVTLESGPTSSSLTVSSVVAPDPNSTNPVDPNSSSLIIVNASNSDPGNPNHTAPNIIISDAGISSSINQNPATANQNVLDLKIGNLSPIYQGTISQETADSKNNTEANPPQQKCQHSEVSKLFWCKKKLVKKIYKKISIQGEACSHCSQKVEGTRRFLRRFFRIAQSLMYFSCRAMV